VFLRWRPANSADRQEERFDDLDSALDAAEARWEELQHQAPQLLDKRRVLVVSTEELQRLMQAEDAP
jgi:predicted  nucleic acid-binding Zn-ribbon protein